MIQEMFNVGAIGKGKMSFSNRNMTMLITLLLVSVLSLPAQKVMKLDDNLKKNSTAMQVKRKGVKTVGKYQFGSYKILTGKAGWSTTKSTSQSGLINMESDEKRSFVFVANQKDTIIANIGITTTSRIQGPSFLADLFGLESYELEESKEIYSVTFNSISDDIWNLLVISPKAVEIEDTIVPDTITEFKGLLSDGALTIRIEQTFEREDGKSSLFNPFKGYEFFLDNSVIGAVQVLPINKQLVWIHNELDENMRGVVATTAVSLLVRTF